MKKLLYIEIAEKIMIEVLKTGMEANSKVPSVREMALKYQANPKTIQKAFDHLDDLGIFHSVIGGGRYLADDQNIITNIKKQLIEAEIIEFVEKMQSFECDLAFIIDQVKEKYE